MLNNEGNLEKYDYEAREQLYLTDNEFNPTNLTKLYIAIIKAKDLHGTTPDFDLNMPHSLSSDELQKYLKNKVFIGLLENTDNKLAKTSIDVFIKGQRIQHKM